MGALGLRDGCTRGILDFSKEDAMRLIINFRGVTGETYRILLRNAGRVKLGNNNYTSLEPAFWDFNAKQWIQDCSVPNEITEQATEVCAGQGLYSLVLPPDFHGMSNLNIDYIIYRMLGGVGSWANYEYHTDCGCQMNLGIPSIGFGCDPSHYFSSC